MSRPRPEATLEPDELVELGVITRPQGVRGEVRVHPFNPDSTLLGELAEIFLVPEGGEPRRQKVKSSRRMPKVFVYRLEGVADHESADALRGQIVALPRASLPEPEEDEYYLVDLKGLRAIGLDGACLGEIVDVMEYPSADCIRVRCEDGHREIPLMAQWVREVDLDAGEVRLDAIDDIPLEEPRKKKPKKKPRTETP